MARTKQTARKSSGGFAPRKQLATKSSVEMRSFLLNQQAAGGSRYEKKIFVNCENTLGSFSFKRPRVSKPFDPVVSCAVLPSTEQAVAARGTRSTARSAQDKASSFLMRLDFSSSLDGALTKSDRQPLDIVFVVDVSGSMSSALPDDSDRRSKLAIAQDCMRKIADELKPCDRVGLVSFNDSPSVRLSLQRATTTNIQGLQAAIGGLVCCGGTALAAGLQGGYDVLLNTTNPVTADDSEFRIKRVIFLTDMDSSAQDENAVIALAHQHAAVAVRRHADEAAPGPGPRSARKRALTEVVAGPVLPAAIHMTLVGVGVDLSVSAVERISAIPGAHYVSVINAAEFFGTVVADFNYDVTPIAFDIRLALPPGLAFLRICGSAELNAVKSGATEATVSSEFPVHLDEEGCTHGGLYLCQLTVTDRTLLPAEPQLRVSWTDPTGTRMVSSVAMRVPREDQVAEEVDIGLRKAAALVEYVQCLTDFATASSSADQAVAGAGACASSMVGAGLRQAAAMVQSWAAGGAGNQAAAAAAGTSISTLPCSEATAAALVNLRTAGVLATVTAVDLPADTPPALLKPYATATRFLRAKQRLLEVMAAAQDTSLTGSNANVLQTIDQVINFETAEIARVLDHLRSCLGKGATTPGPTEGTQDVPRGYLCPISLAVMADPVVAQDGHSYERAAIATWFASGRTTSPVTNLPLANCNLAPNHALRVSIEEYQLLLASRAEQAPTSSGRRRSYRKTVAFNPSVV